MSLHLFRAVAVWCHHLQPPVLHIADIISGRPVDPRQFCHPGQHLVATPVLFFEHGVKQAGQDYFRLADREQVHDLGQRFRVHERADATAQHQRLPVAAFLAPERQVAELENGRQVQVIVFKGDRERHQVELVEGTLGFDRNQREAGAAVFVEVFRVGQEEPLAEGVFAAVEHPVDGLQAEVAHPLIVAVRVDQGHRQSAAPGLGAGAGLLGRSPAVFIDQVA